MGLDGVGYEPRMLAEPSLEVLEIILEFLGISQSRDEPRHHLAPGDNHEDRDDKDVLAGGAQGIRLHAKKILKKIP